MTLHSVPSTQEWLTREELAELMRVSVRTVDRMRQAGMPSENWGRAFRVFDRDEALRWAREQGRAA